MAITTSRHLVPDMRQFALWNAGLVSARHLCSLQCPTHLARVLLPKHGGPSRCFLENRRAALLGELCQPGSPLLNPVCIHSKRGLRTATVVLRIFQTDCQIDFEREPLETIHYGPNLALTLDWGSPGVLEMVLQLPFSGSIPCP